MSESRHDPTFYAPSAARALQPAVPANVTGHEMSGYDSGSSGTRPALRRAAAAGSFADVFEKYAPYVLRVLPRLGVSPADAEDVAQDVFITVFRKLPEFEGRSSIRTWIYGICIRTASNYRQRAYRRYETASDPPPETMTPAPQPFDVQQRRDLDLLDAALRRISAPKRDVFVLYEIEELSMQEVARAVGCPLFTAYARLYAARREIRALFTRVGRRKP